MVIMVHFFCVVFVGLCLFVCLVGLLLAVSSLTPSFGQRLTGTAGL